MTKNTSGKRARILFNTYTVQLKRRQIQVCIPIMPIERVYIYTQQEGYNNMIYGDSEGLYQIFLCTVYMHHHKECIMYIPTVPKEVLDLHRNWVESPNQYQSIVQVHHTIQLNLKDWKNIKKSLRYKKPKREIFEVDVEGATYEAILKEVSEKAFYQEFKDFIDFKSHYKSIFLIGSLKSFEVLAGGLWSLIKDEEGNRQELAQYGIPHIHLDWLIRGRETELCVDFYE